jgi:hypothetical protein
MANKLLRMPRSSVTSKFDVTEAGCESIAHPFDMVVVTQYLIITLSNTHNTVGIQFHAYQNMPQNMLQNIDFRVISNLWVIL